MTLAFPRFAWLPWFAASPSRGRGTVPDEPASDKNKPPPAPSKSSNAETKAEDEGVVGEGGPSKGPEDPGPDGSPAQAGAEQTPPESNEGDDVRALVRGLVSKAKKGDVQAYQQLVERYQKRVFGIVFGMLHSREDAMELAQEVFIKVYQRIGDFEEKSSFYTWVYRIAVNLAIDFRRREWKKVHTEYDDSVADQGVDDGVFQRERASPEQATQNRELGDQIHRALDTLPEEQRAVLVMREVDGLSYQEMADVMRCSIGTIMSRLFYARKKMQAALKGVREAEEP